MRITLDVPQNQVEALLAFLKNLKGVTIQSQENESGLREPQSPQINDEIPDWHKEIVNERLENYKSNPDDLIDFDKAMDDLDKKL